MSETEKTQKKSWFKGLQAEFKRLFGRIENTCKTDHGSCCCSVILGALIAVIDVILRYGIDLLIK